ncbi:mandelate racemase/muconate lactonizing enzyme family protein [Phaeobacter sp. C3_T13_0]|uniref:mandelate racemase/muconate lactonizing enzyme family protein n=1 Tax=Phaeobacter cretensis TaxID=3342641 RepID=UPI0039BD2D91
MGKGKTGNTVETVVVTVETDSGITGWDEVCPIPHCLPAYARGVGPALTKLAPILIGQNPVGVEATMARTDAWLPGHVYAKSALNIARGDITGKAAGRPLYHSITCVAPDEMARIALDAQAQGMTQFQAELGASGDWQPDVERLTKVREAASSDPVVYGDWNCEATSLDAKRVGRIIAHLDIMLEQPSATLDDCARVRSATGLQMKLDELVHDTGSLLEAHGLGIMEVVALKLSKFGGLLTLRRVRDLCLQLGAEMCVECASGSDVAAAAALRRATAMDPSRIQNVCDLSAYVAPRLAPSAPNREQGRIAPPDGPGLGITSDTDLLGPPDLILD